MLACAYGDAKELQGRKTVGVTTDQKVVLRFSPPGMPAFNAEFSAKGWSGAKPNLSGARSVNHWTVPRNRTI